MLKQWRNERFGTLAALGVLDTLAASGARPTRAIQAITRMIAELDRVGERLPGPMYTVGMLQLTPGALSVISKEAYFSIDVRHPEDAVVAAFDEAVRAALTTVPASLTRGRQRCANLVLCAPRSASGGPPARRCRVQTRCWSSHSRGRTS